MGEGSLSATGVGRDERVGIVARRDEGVAFSEDKSGEEGAGLEGVLGVIAVVPRREERELGWLAMLSGAGSDGCTTSDLFPLMEKAEGSGVEGEFVPLYSVIDRFDSLVEIRPGEARRPFDPGLKT
ncbi:hypothetical protein NUW54_g8815 [Trametes sanguinea]|uniref:Uncharacterized protein n=1 Tax=Trametes sanguinea TaxID=158606 RepID=A0ACC1PDB3_9APHY|nr:hypothetical protein NUW54_g8815 [Trametes sanguinea]